MTAQNVAYVTNFVKERQKGTKKLSSGFSVWHLALQPFFQLAFKSRRHLTQVCTTVLVCIDGVLIDPRCLASLDGRCQLATDIFEQVLD